jgi:hypothetical protein
MGRFVGPGYVRVGPVTAGPFGVGCLLPTLMVVAIVAIILA